jgi:hypothetical protein
MEAYLGSATCCQRDGFVEGARTWIGLCLIGSQLQQLAGLGSVKPLVRILSIWLCASLLLVCLSQASQQCPCAAPMQVGCAPGDPNPAAVKSGDGQLRPKPANLVSGDQAVSIYIDRYTLCRTPAQMPAQTVAVLRSLRSYGYYPTVPWLLL